MRMLSVMSLLLTTVICTTAINADDPAPVPGSIEVINQAGKKFTYTKQDVDKLPRLEITANDHKGNEAQYSGVSLDKILQASEVPMGSELKGKALTNCLVVEAADRYRVLFSLPENDPEWSTGVVLLATARNGEALDAAHGPFQLVVPAEKRQSRWVKQVVKLSIRTDEK